MTLIDKIKNDLMDDRVPLYSILRKVLVLAYERHDENLKQWILLELTGYATDTPVPEYRKSHTQSYGNLVGPGWAQLNKVVLPPSCVPKQFQDYVYDVPLRENIRNLEETLRRSLSGNDSGCAMIWWPGDLVALLQDKFYVGYRLISAWVLVQPSDLLSVVENLRNKLLMMILDIDPSYRVEEIKKASPDTNATTLNFYGNVMNSAITGTSSDVAQTNQLNIPKGDWEALAKTLIANGVREEDLKALKIALDEDACLTKDSMGAKTASWLSKVGSSLCSFTKDVAAQTVASIASAALTQYLGLGARG